MSTTLTRPAVSGTASPGLRIAPIGHRRRPALAVGSLALVVACVAVFISVYMKAGHQVEVLALTRSVPQGQMLTTADLKVVRMSVATGVESVPAAEAASVVGRRVAEGLEPDTLLSTSELVADYSPPVGQAIVGVAAKEGQVPASGVVAGETVDVVLTGLPGEQDEPVATGDGDGSSADTATSTATGTAAEGSDDEPGVAAGTVLVPDATVLEASLSPASSGSDTMDVSLLMPSSLAPLVASASTAGEIALVVVAPGR